MKVNIQYKTLKALQKTLKTAGNSWRLTSGVNLPPEEELTPDSKVPIDMTWCDVNDLRTILDVLTTHGEHARHTVSKVIKALMKPAESKITQLSQMPQILTKYLSGADPLLYDISESGRGATYLPINVKYIQPRDRHPAYVTLTLAYLIKGSFKTRSLVFEHEDVNRTCKEALECHNLSVATNKLVEDHGKIMARFNKYLTMNKSQFKGRGEVSLRDQSSDYDWWSTRNRYNLSVAGKPSKVVLDLLDRNENSDTFARSLVRSTDSSIYGKQLPVPVHPVLPVFSLKLHKDVWLSVVNMAPYTYETDLHEKLVLPPSHTRLISALVSNLELLKQTSEDDPKRSKILDAKAKSSVILAKGPSGTGKTLTAEVYAEQIQRPLYEVNSGQLGTHPDYIETNLEEALARSSRLEMPLLINEADVFVRKRGFSLEQSAVVSVFLRLLEYHDGLVFLTTNLAEDIDEAILSRCIAEIAFDRPDAAGRKRLWEITLSEFGASLTPKEIKSAVDVFPSVVGRDIQKLVGLTTRVCKATGTDFNLQALIENAAFRGIDISGEEVRKNGN